MEDVYYSVIETQSNFYACDKPLDGIIGVAFNGLNPAYTTPSDADADVYCDAGGSAGKLVGCKGGVATKDLMSPILKALQQDVDSGYNFGRKFGFYVNYATTTDAAVNTLVPGLGIYFGGDMAANNVFYNGGTPQVRADSVF